jgi:hypothetical protein
MELAKAGKMTHALKQSDLFERSVRTSEHLDSEEVWALIAMHGRSALLRDLFITRLGYFRTGQNHSMQVEERASYSAMALYLAEHFHGDARVGQAMVAVAESPLIHSIGVIGLCRGWPDLEPIPRYRAMLRDLMDAPEPVTAWLFATCADALQLADYLLRYPKKLKQNDPFREAREGITALQTRLQSDFRCREILFDGLSNITETDTVIALAKLLGPSMRSDSEFCAWVSQQLRITGERDRTICQFAYDLFSNEFKPVEFALFEAMLTRY